MGLKGKGLTRSIYKVFIDEPVEDYKVSHKFYVVAADSIDDIKSIMESRGMPEPLASLLIHENVNIILSIADENASNL